MKATFKVQHDVLSGLKYLQVVKRKGLKVGKDQEMIVSLGKVLCQVGNAEINPLSLYRVRMRPILWKSHSTRKSVGCL